MDSKLSRGDHAVDRRGFPVELTGSEELLQQAMIRLLVPKGSFVRDRSLGSELYKLQGPGGTVDRAALAYAQEALSGMSGLSVEAAECARLNSGSLRVTVSIRIDEQSYELQAEVTG